MRVKSLLYMSILFLFICPVFGQSNIKGQVLDEKNQPLAGASISEKFTKKGTTSNADGSFTLSAKPGTKLIVTAIGYDAYEMTAGSNMVVKLNVDTKLLNDVVITGVGVATSRKRVAIDVASVNIRDFAKSATGSIEQALTGQIAGAQIQQNGGTPGSGYNIILRGINSLGNSNPLILVDGVQVLDLTSLDPSNVERVEVVKGAAGGTLYGAQGANGVIQVFTKKGSINSKLNINASSKVSIDNILQGNNILAQNHHYTTDAAGNILNSSGNIISRDATGAWADPAVPDPGTNPGTVNNKSYNIPTFNHVSQAFRQALTTNHSISLTGGGNSIDYAFTLSRIDQEDVFSNKYSRNNISANLGFQLFKGFTFRTSTQAIIGSNNLLNGNRFAVLNAYPWVDLNWRDSTGKRTIKTSAASNQNNSLSEQDWHQTTNQSLSIVQNFNLNYKINRFVEVDFKYGLNYSNGTGSNIYQNQSAALQSSLHWGTDRLGSILNSNSNDTYKNALSTVYLKTDFQKDFHSRIPIRTVTQVSYDWRSDNYASYYAQGIQLPSYPPVNINVAQIKTAGDNNNAFTTFGVLVNQTLDYANLFGISAGLRSDYSSEFGAGSKPFTFPRASVYFRPSELLGKTFITDWKVRAAYGEAGIQPARYQRQVTFDVLPLGSSVALSLPNVASNSNLRVQVSKEFETGSDISFNVLSGNWLHKATFSGTYWKRTSSDIIQQANVSASSGFGNRVDNLTTISSKGMDLSLDASVYNSPNIVWNLGLRLGFAKSKIDKISNGLDIISGDFALRQGESLGIFYGQTPLKSFTQLQVDGKTPYITAANQQYYTIVNGNVVDTRTNAVKLTAANDLSVIGNAYPKFTASMFNNITLFKKLTISFQFDWIHGNSIYNQTKQWLYSPAGGSGGSGGVSADFDKQITINGKTGAFVNYYQSLYNLVRPLSTFVEDGSFVRLRDVSISYDLTEKLRIKWLKRLSVTASGRNLFTITKYSGMDPENTAAVDTQGNTLSGIGVSKGVDNFGVPNLKSYQLGVNIGF